MLRRVIAISDACSDYKATLISNLHIAMSVLILSTHCLHLIFAHKAANLFYFIPPPLPPSYMVACLYYLCHYGNILPILRRDGVTSLLLDLFLGVNRVEGRSDITTILLNAIVEYPSSNRLVYGMNSDKKPNPIL